jgi:hypothetical protein
MFISEDTTVLTHCTYSGGIEHIKWAVAFGTSTLCLHNVPGIDEHIKVVCS